MADIRTRDQDCRKTCRDRSIRNGTSGDVELCRHGYLLLHTGQWNGWVRLYLWAFWRWHQYARAVRALQREATP